MERIIEDKKVIFTSNRYPGVTVNDITEPELTLTLGILISAVSEYYDNSENQKRFEEWYLKKYGKPYEENIIIKQEEKDEQSFKR